MAKQQLQRFGGDWTQQKLDVLKKYLEAYTQALKKQGFRKAYFDAFAGTGYRDLPPAKTGPTIFDNSAVESRKFREGSALLALRVEPPFDEYFFVEKRSKKHAELKRLIQQVVPDDSKKIKIMRGDANSCLQDWCEPSSKWRDLRAVAFLDPYGMQVEWKTLQSIAGTHSIDLWLLFPVGIGVGRLLTRSLTALPRRWRDRLTKTFGTSEWEKHFYKPDEQPPLFVDPMQGDEIRIGNLDAVSDFFSKRLKSIFPFVSKNPIYLRNSTGSPLYQLFFAAANPGRGGSLALSIAEDILARAYRYGAK